MKILQPVAAVEYCNHYGDDQTIALSYNADTTYPWEVTSLGDDFDSDTYTRDGLISFAQAKIREYDACPDSYHDEDDDDYDHDEDQCEYVIHADEREAWQFILDTVLNFGGGLANTASAVLADDLTWNHAALYPQARAVFSFDADRLTIRNAVIRALQLQGVDQSQVDQFTYEADSNPNILGVAQRWVTCS